MEGTQTKTAPSADLAGAETRAELPRPSVKLLVAVALVTAVAHGIGLGNGFLGWDDGETILTNLRIRSLSPENLAWMFTTFHMGPYQPLSWLSLAIDYQIWGLNPFGFHLTNLLLHLLAAILCVSVAWRLLLFSRPSRGVMPTALALGSSAAALLFAIHPLRVESVAWVTERRDVLSGALALLATLLYLKAFVPDPETGRAVRVRALWPAWLVFVLAGLAKATVVAFPVVLLLVDWYPLRRYRGVRSAEFWGCVREKLFPFAAALVLGLVAIAGQALEGTLAPIAGYPIGRRLASAAFGVGFYLTKMVVPIALSPIYEQPETLTAWHYAYIALGVVLLLGVTAWTWIARHRWPALWVGWLAFLAILAPVSGLLQAGPQIAADRYTYLASMPLAVVVGSGVAWLVQQFGGASVGLIVGVVSLLLCLLTAQQTTYWNNDMALWQHAVRVQPQASLAYSNLAAQYYQNGDLTQAERYARIALRLRPSNASAHNVLGNILADRGEYEEALKAYEAALAIRPGEPIYLYNMASVLHHLDRHDEAIGALQEVLRQQPDNVRAMNNLALLYKAKKQYDKAEQLLAQVMRLDRESGTPIYNLANLKAEQGKVDEAIRLYELALQVEPTFVSPAVRLAEIYESRGDWARAKSVLQRAYLANPTHVNTRYHLGLLLAAAPDASVREPRQAELHGRWLIDQARDIRGFDVLAAALAARGQFEDALRVIERGLLAARQAGFREEAEKLQQRRELYRARKPLVLTGPPTEELVTGHESEHAPAAADGSGASAASQRQQPGAEAAAER